MICQFGFWRAVCLKVSHFIFNAKFIIFNAKLIIVLTNFIIVDPRRCKFDPATLECPPDAGTEGSCLTSAQVQALKAAVSRQHRYRH